MICTLNLDWLYTSSYEMMRSIIITTKCGSNTHKDPHGIQRKWFIIIQFAERSKPIQIPVASAAAPPTAAGPGAFINGGAWDEKRRISFWLNHLQNKAICFTTKCYYALAALQEHRIVKSTKPLTSSFPPQDWNRASVVICSAWNSSSVFSSVRLGMA